MPTKVEVEEIENSITVLLKIDIPTATGTKTQEWPIPKFLYDLFKTDFESGAIDLDAIKARKGSKTINI